MFYMGGHKANILQTYSTGTATYCNILQTVAEMYPRGIDLRVKYGSYNYEYAAAVLSN